MSYNYMCPELMPIEGKEKMTQKKRNYLNEQIDWTRTRDLLNPFETTIDGDKLVIHLNDFFDDEYQYTLMLNDEEYIGFDKWPDNWTRSPSDFVDIAIKITLELQFKLDQQQEITMEDLEILKRYLQKVPPINVPEVS